MNAVNITSKVELGSVADQSEVRVNEPRYAIVTPARNEEKFLQSTVDAIVAQTIRPIQWIIVNDGSSDSTGRIAEEAARRYDWIRVVHRNDRGKRQAGGGVVEAFYDGFDVLEGANWDYLVKLDGDVTFEPDYFERCFARFESEQSLGIGGGLICGLANGSLYPESAGDPEFHVRGATKIYKQNCWQAIGGLARMTGWDTVDELKANMLGWTTRTFKDIKVIHHRPAGDAYGVWPNWIKNGRANYVAGYHPIFMFVKCLKRLFQKPYGIAGVGLAVGFVGGYIKRAPRIDDARVIRYFRREQMKRLFLRNSLWG